MKKGTEQKRKTYSLDVNRSRELAQHALNMTKSNGDRSITRQSILDELVGLLNDEKVYNEIYKKLKSGV